MSNYSNQYKEEYSESNEYSVTESDTYSSARSLFSMGRQKLFNAVKVSKEQGFLSSIPKSITQSFSYDEETNMQTSLTVPDDAKFKLYKTYSRVARHGYITNIRGLMYCDGIMNRRNRLLYSLFYKLVKQPSVSNEVGSMISSELEDALIHPDTANATLSDTASFTTHSSSSSSTTTSGVIGDVIKERMKGVMARTITKAPLKITIGAKDELETLLSVNFTTDNTGSFELSIATPYYPSSITVCSVDNANITITEDVEVVPEHGVSVISDVDDTIRTTGVLMEKREMFSNVFAKDFIDCEVPGLAEWFNMLYHERKCAMHYVSNSPWQIYNIITDFLEFENLPTTSVHLRQYSGNLIASFTLPAGERKKGSLLKIVRDFPKRKFILVGDSGEQDFESYMAVAQEYPDQVLAIYIRAIDDAFSTIDNQKVFQELQNRLTTREAVYNSVNNILHPDDAQSDLQISEIPPLTPKEPSKDSQPTAEKQSGRLPPIVPPKPKHLQGNSYKPPPPPPLTTDIPERAPPELPRRSSQPMRVEQPRLVQNDTSNSAYQRQRAPPPLPSRMKSPIRSPLRSSKPRSLTSPRLGDSGWGPLNDEDEIDYMYGTDKRRDIWRDRITRVLTELPPSIGFKFWWTVDDVILDSLKLCDSVESLNSSNTANQDPVKSNDGTPKDEKLVDL